MNNAKGHQDATGLMLSHTHGSLPSTIDQGILLEFIGMYLRRAHEVAYEDFQARLGNDALQPGYFTILTLIVRNPMISQTQIGAASMRDKSSVTKALRWMEEAELIVRVRALHDRRIHLSSATAKGIARQARMESLALDHLKALDEAIGVERYKDFIETLKDLIQNMERIRKDCQGKP